MIAIRIILIIKIIRVLHPVIDQGDQPRAEERSAGAAVAPGRHGGARRQRLDSEVKPTRKW